MRKIEMNLKVIVTCDDNTDDGNVAKWLTQLLLETPDVKDVKVTKISALTCRYLDCTEKNPVCCSDPECDHLPTCLRCLETFLRAASGSLRKKPT